MKTPLTTVGLDIGSSKIRAVQVTKKRDTYIIDKVASIATPPGAVFEGEIMERKQVSAALAQLWKIGKFDTKYVKLGIGSRKVYSQLIEQDQMSHKMYKDVLPGILSDYLPEGEEFYFDYHKVGVYTRMEENPSDVENAQLKQKMQIIYTAIPKSIVNSIIPTLKEAGLKPISIDLNPFALLRANSKESGTDEGGQISIDIGARTSTLVIAVNGQAKYTRVVSGSADSLDSAVGGDDITATIAKQLNIPLSKAEERKIEAISGGTSPADLEALEFDDTTESGGAFGRRQDNRGNYSEEKDQERLRIERLLAAKQITNTVISNTVQDINSAVTDFTESPVGSGFNPSAMSIHPIVLSGGVMGTLNIQDRIQRSMSGLATVMAKPLSSRNFKKNVENEHEYTIAVGLAIGEGGTNGN